MKLARKSLMIGTTFFIVCGQSLLLCSDRRGRRREKSISTPRSLSVPPSPRSKEESLGLALLLAHEETSGLQDQIRDLKEQNKDMDQRFQVVVENAKNSLTLADKLIQDNALLSQAFLQHKQANATLALQNAILLHQNKELLEKLASMCPGNNTQQ